MDDKSALQRMAYLVLDMTNPELCRPHREQLDVMARILAKDLLKRCGRVDE